MHASFEADLIAQLPKLRSQAMGMTRNRADAEDLVQDAVASAIAAAASFTPGTHFGAWMHRILRNRFISTLRRRRPTTELDNAPAAALSVQGDQESALLLKQVARGMARLTPEGRKALEMVALDGLSYIELSQASGQAIGTGKSRVFRARRQLQAWMDGGAAEAARLPAAAPQATLAA
jgi:RNA polymerase sigma-70 factor (ECF subfamily)